MENSNIIVFRAQTDMGVVELDIPVEAAAQAGDLFGWFMRASDSLLAIDGEAPEPDQAAGQNKRSGKSAEQ